MADINNRGTYTVDVTLYFCDSLLLMQKIIVKTDGKEMVVEQGGVMAAPVEDVVKPARKTGKTGLVGSVTLPAASPRAGEGEGGGVVGGVLASTGSVVLACVFPSSKKQVMAAAKSGEGVLQVTAPPQPCECE